MSSGTWAMWLWKWPSDWVLLSYFPWENWWYPDETFPHFLVGYWKCNFRSHLHLLLPRLRGHGLFVCGYDGDLDHLSISAQTLYLRISRLLPFRWVTYSNAFCSKKTLPQPLSSPPVASLCPSESQAPPWCLYRAFPPLSPSALYLILDRFLPLQL